MGNFTNKHPPRTPGGEGPHGNRLHVRWPAADIALVTSNSIPSGSFGEDFQRAMVDVEKEDLGKVLDRIRKDFSALYYEIAVVATSDALETGIPERLQQREKHLEQRLIRFYKEAHLPENRVGECLVANYKALREAAMELREHWDMHPDERPVPTVPSIQPFSMN